METSLSPLQATPGSELEDSFSGPKDRDSRHHVLSKHSLVGQIEMPNKQDSFLVSPSPPEPQRENASNALEIRHVNNEIAVLPTFSPSMHICDTPLHGLPDLSLPDFELDSSILLPSSWFEALSSDQDVYLDREGPGDRVID